jgi:SP family arabinose:H+ symporter-like MFS transporter
VSQFFLTLIDSIGNSATFYLFGAFSVIAYIWIWKTVPETKGRSLEQIQELWGDEDPVQTQRDAGTL